MPTAEERAASSAAYNVALGPGLEIDRYWNSVVTKEPIPSKIKQLVKADLIKSWHSYRYESYRQNMQINWATIDDQRITLGDTTSHLDYSLLCNKATACYWLPSAQYLLNNGERNLDKIIFAAIFEEWIRCDDQNIEFDHFFAGPIRITSTGPSTITEVIAAHQSLCRQTDDMLSSTESPRLREHHSLIAPFRAVVVIFDRLDEIDIESGGFKDLCKLAQHQTVLLVRTGTETALREPISFDSLKPQSLPLECTDIMPDSIDVIRVSIATAIRFVVQLEQKENPALSRANNDLDHRLTPVRPRLFGDPKTNLPSEVILGSPGANRSPESWANIAMAGAEEYGYDSVIETWYSIRRVQSNLLGQDYADLEDHTFHPEYTYGSCNKHKFKKGI
jgi:hypothetical protein